MSTGWKRSIYTYPMEGDVAIFFTTQGAKANINNILYINMPRVKACDLEIKTYFDKVEAKKKAQQSKDSKEF